LAGFVIYSAAGLAVSVLWRYRFVCLSVANIDA